VALAVYLNEFPVVLPPLVDINRTLIRHKLHLLLTTSAQLLRTKVWGNLVHYTSRYYSIFHRWKRLQMGKGIVVIILYKCLSALLWLESKLIVAACWDASVRQCTNSEIPLITLASLHAATISLDSSLKRAEWHLYKMMTTIPLPICNLFHLWLISTTISWNCTFK
jgi:hypothetical protein